MADKQISQLTEVANPVSTDVYVCQQSTTAKKITLNALRNWILKVSGLSTSVTSNLTGNEYLLVDQSSTAKKIKLDDFMNTRLQTNTTVYDADYFMVHSGNYPKKVQASTLKAYCSGSSSTATFFATYGYTDFASIQSAYIAGKVLYCTYNNTIWCPAVQFDGSTFKFYDAINKYICSVDSSSAWSRVAQ
jgi:hypothetical protein